MATTADFKNGLCLEYNNDLYTIVEFQHVKPGKGPAFVRTKLKSLTTGKVIENTFTAGHKVTTARIERRPHQYLYNDDLGYHFMDSSTSGTHGSATPCYRCVEHKCRRRPGRRRRNSAKLRPRRASRSVRESARKSEPGHRRRLLRYGPRLSNRGIPVRRSRAPFPPSGRHLRPPRTEPLPSPVPDGYVGA